MGNFAGICHAGDAAGPDHFPAVPALLLEGINQRKRERVEDGVRGVQGEGGEGSRFNACRKT